ncbi:MAG: M23 family metallopeptidase [Chitinispirillaceae bacterium]|jgi:murein DD-endopeptidase MepM/ murein hydrolase activator NlpD
MKNKSILLISQSGRPVRSIKINFLTVFFPAVFIASGFAAYFIPSNLFKIKSDERQQKKELTAQNEILHQRFFSTLKVLSRANEQINLLDAKKDMVSALIGPVKDVEAQNRPTPVSRNAAAEYAGMNTTELLDHVNRQDSIVSAFAARTNNGVNPFEYLPVCKPVTAADARLSRPFGENRDPFTGEKKWHYGIDLAAAPGTPVIATASGYVARIENDEVWGKRVVIDHGAGISTVYAHLGGVKLSSDRRVKRGDIVGYIGISGHTTGPHVHYEIWRNGTALDPEAFFFPLSGEK